MIVREAFKQIGLEEKEVGLRWGMGNIFEDKLRAQAKCSSGQAR
jgi:hypothetical protein